MGAIAIGSEVAGYRVDALVARGGMGVVYRATHLRLERTVALKVIARELADRPGFRERFLRESRLAARLDHPAVVPVYDSREVDGELLVAMRYVAGGDLRKLIDREGRLEPGRAVALLAQVGEALDAAHAAGIVHRDVKPHNVMVEGERAYLTDFGLAKALGESGSQPSGASVVGTVEYMSPEQWSGGAVGPAADTYSLGCVLYEALTGIAPFARHGADAEPEIPAGLEGVIERAVARDPEHRYPTSGALIEAARERQGGELARTRVLSREETGDEYGIAGQRPTRPPARPSRRRPSRRELSFAAGCLAALAAVVVALASLLGGGGLEVSDPIPVGAPPLRLATGAGAIWVTSERDGTLTRLDPDDGQPVGDPIELGFGISGVAVGPESVWVTDPPSGQLLRVDPGSGEVVQRVRLGGRPGPVAYGGGRVWVADADGAGVSAVNARGGRVHHREIVPHAAPLRLAVGAGGLWVSSASTGTVRRIDLSTTAPEPAATVAGGPSDLTVSGGFVWVARSRADAVTTIDTGSRLPAGTPIRVGERPGGVASGTEIVWVSLAGEDAVARLDAESREPAGDPVPVGPEPGAVVVGERAVWVVNNGDGTVTRIEP